MKIEIVPVEPQPILADAKAPGRWIWAPVEPVTDMCREQANGEKGNSVVSWWNDTNSCESLARYYKGERSLTTTVDCAFDGTRWVWIVRTPDSVYWDVDVSDESGQEISLGCMSFELDNEEDEFTMTCEVPLVSPDLIRAFCERVLHAYEETFNT